MNLYVFATGYENIVHVFESCFVSGVQWCNQVSSPIITLAREALTYPGRSPAVTANPRESQKISAYVKVSEFCDIPGAVKENIAQKYLDSQVL